MVEHEFKQKVKNSFKNAKEHMEKIEKDLFSQKKDILAIKTKLEEIIRENKDLKEKLNIFLSSTGNNGVKQINKQINKQTTKQLSTINVEEIQEKIEYNFKKLTKQELKTFLSIYQLEEEKKEVSYVDVATSLGITESCTRIYVANLIKKGAPIKKIKINNKKVLLSIRKDFKNLNLKQKLVEIYYKLDPDQTKLA